MATSAFGKAFRAAREAGNTEFEFGGKKYNTKMKDDSASSPPVKKAAPVKETSSAKVDAPVKETSSAKVDAPAKVDALAEDKPYRPKNLTDLLGLSSNIKKTTDAPAPKETSKPNLGEQGRKSEENERMIKGAASDVGTAIMDYANKPYVSPAARIADENKGKTYRDLSGKVQTATGMKRGGAVKKMASGGMASSRGDGIAQRGKTRGKMC
jgi:hypothetical protein